MKKTKAQRDYHEQMAELNKESEGMNASYKKPKRSFRDSKLYYYGIRIILILIALRIISAFDTAIYSIINYYR